VAPGDLFPLKQGVRVPGEKQLAERQYSDNVSFLNVRESNFLILSKDKPLSSPLTGCHGCRNPTDPIKEFEHKGKMKSKALSDSSSIALSEKQ